jgi:hypothetical protein
MGSAIATDWLLGSCALPIAAGRVVCVEKSALLVVSLAKKKGPRVDPLLIVLVLE